MQPAYHDAVGPTMSRPGSHTARHTARSPVGGYPATRVEFAAVVNAGIRGDLPPTEFQIQRLRSNNKRRKDCSSSGHA